MTHWNFYGLVCLFLLSATPGRAQQDYNQKVLTWRTEREAALKAEGGWLNLAGRFTLPPGLSRFGAAKTNRVVFPSGKCPDSLGCFTVRNDSVWMQLFPEVRVLADGKPCSEKPLLLHPSPAPVTLQSGALRWFIIRRGDQFMVRLRDLEHPALQDFHGVPAFPADTTWRFPARFEPTAGKKIVIVNVLGQTSWQDSPGCLAFEHQGNTYRLDALQEGQQLFLLFADETNGLETYGAGRFLYTDLPDASGHTTLDFNYAINPPCAFTDFATCPLPPRQNALPFQVKAGEKSYGKH